MNKANTALILVDIQNDYFPEGKNPLVGSMEAGEQAGRLLRFFRQKQLPRVFIQHISTRAGAKFFLPGTAGAEIHASIQPLPGETIFEKHYPNSFRETGLLEYLHLEQVQRVVICGMMTHMCVDATARAAYDHGFECLVASDACATKDLAFEGQQVAAVDAQRAFLAALQGTYGRVLRVNEVIKALEMKS